MGSRELEHNVEHMAGGRKNCGDGGRHDSVRAVDKQAAGNPGRAGQTAVAAPVGPVT
jgi:hypothetical protein